MSTASNKFVDVVLYQLIAIDEEYKIVRLVEIPFLLRILNLGIKINPNYVIRVKIKSL